MKKVITFVGTSLLENYRIKNKNNNFNNYFNDLKDKGFSDYENEKNRVSGLKKYISNWVKDKVKDELIDLCAEVKSIYKIYEEVNDNMEIYFLTSDTVLSNIAFELIKESWKTLPYLSNLKIHPSDKENAVIKDLQINDRTKFKNGLVNLINKVDNISQGYWENVIFNITAGYKAVIPFLTILAQINKCPIYYIFENTDTLMKIPSIPIDLQWEVFKKNEDFFFDLELEGIKEVNDDLQLREEIESLIEKSNNLISLNPLGIILWEKYKSSFYLFRISKIAKDYIDSKKYDVRRVIEKSFLELFRRLKENPSDPDLDHKLNNVNFPEGFKTFKHKEDNLQVRILYKKEDYKTRYGISNYRIYIGNIAVGNDTHNSESEYVETFKKDSEKIKNLRDYHVYRIERKEIKS